MASLLNYELCLLALGGEALLCHGYERQTLHNQDLRYQDCLFRYAFSLLRLTVGKFWLLYLIIISQLTIFIPCLCIHSR